MFKILSTTKFRDRVVNYAQTVCEHVGTMREDACQCLTVRAMPRLSRIATDSSRTAHVEFTTCSRAVHEQFRYSSRLVRYSGARVGAWVYTGLPGHCSPFQRSPAKRQLISQTTCRYKKADEMARLATTKSWPKVVQVSALHKPSSESTKFQKLTLSQKALVFTCLQ